MANGVNRDSHSTVSDLVGGTGHAPFIPDHELVRFIASGGFGSVWLARNIMRTWRAVKVVFRHNFKNDHEYEREFRGIQKFDPISRTHGALIDVLQVGRNDEAGYFYYVMEVADDVATGQEIDPSKYEPKTLDQELARRGRLPFGECIQIGLAVADGLRHLHEKGLIHRDIKPGNLIYINGLPKIADIGLVTEVSEAKSFPGTPGYMAPERPWTGQADIYSLGKVLYEAGLGKDRNSFPSLPTGWDSTEDREQLLELNEIINKACDTNLQARYQTAADLHADLLVLQGGQSLRKLRFLEQRLARARKVGAVAFFIMLAVLGLLLQARRSEQAARRRLADSYVTVGARAMDQGDLIGSLLWFTEALTLDSDNGDRDRERDNRVRIATVLRQSPKVERIWFPRSPALCVDATADGRWVLAGEANGTVSLWPLDGNQTNALELSGHRKEVLSVASSPDGRWLVSGGADKTVRIWDAARGREERLIQHTNLIQSVRFSPDSQRIVGVDEGGLGIIWQRETGTVLGIFRQEGATFAAFDPTGSILAVTSQNGGRAQLWNIAAMDRIGSPFSRTHYAGSGEVEDFLYQAAFSVDGGRLATASYYKEAQIWEVSTGRLLHRLAHAQAVRSVRFSPDGAKILTACDDLTVRLWNARTEEQAGPPLKHGSYVREACFDPSGRRVLAVTSHGGIFVWDISAINWVPSVPREFYSGNGLAYVRLDGFNVQFFQGHPERSPRSWSLPPDFRVERALLDSSGARVLFLSEASSKSGGDDRRCQLWDTSVGMPVGNPFHQSASNFHTARFSPNGRTLAAFKGTSLYVTDAATGAGIASSLDHPRAIAQFRWSPDSRRIAVVLKDFTNVWLWNLDGHLKSTQLEHRGGVQSAEFSPRGDLLVTGCSDFDISAQAAYIWRIDPPEIVGGPLIDVDGVLHAQFSPDGRKVVTSSEFKRAQIWDWKSSKSERLFPQLDEAFFSSFSSDGSWIATSCRDSSVQIWEPTTAKPITPPLRLPWSGQENQVRFVRGDRAVLIERPSRGQWAVAGLEKDSREVKLLALEARVLSGHRSDATGSAMALSIEELKVAWGEYQRAQTNITRSSLLEAVGWHEREAALARDAKDEYALEFHRKRLAELNPVSADSQ